MDSFLFELSRENTAKQGKTLPDFLLKVVLSRTKEKLYIEKKMPKKVVAHKQPKGSSSFDFDQKRFVLADVQARFDNSVTGRSGLRERGFDIDIESPRMEHFKRIIESRGWQIFCRHPKAATMTMVREFYANAWDNTPTLVVFVREKQVRYDAGTINQLLQLQYTLHGPDEIDLLAESANMENISTEICGRVIKWDIVKGVYAHFPSKDLQ